MNKPNDGGSYRQNPDGSLTQLSPTTGERPCKCRSDEHARPARKPTARPAKSKPSRRVRNTQE